MRPPKLSLSDTTTPSTVAGATGIFGSTARGHLEDRIGFDGRLPRQGSALRPEHDRRRTHQRRDRHGDDRGHRRDEGVVHRRHDDGHQRQGGRDNQFPKSHHEHLRVPGRATFELTSPIKLAPIPKDGTVKAYQATGKLTLHGTTKTVTVTLNTKRTGNVIQVQGDLPITFSDYGIDNPSGGPAQVGDDGQMEFLLQLQPS